MPRVLTIVVPEGANLEPDALYGKLTESGALDLREWHWIEPGRAGEWLVDSGEDSLSIANYVAEKLADLKMDFAVQPEVLRRKKLLLSDMDSTLIGQECIDELAKVAGIGEKVAVITERAMRGELEFESALIERVGLLKDLRVNTLDNVWKSAITLNKGADWLMATLHHFGVLRVLVSGGFDFFTSRVTKALDMDSHFANILGVKDDVLDGTVIPPILGKEAKWQVLVAQAQTLGISLQETIAIGDGANDLPMLNAAGLGIAYYAKPAVQAETTARINAGDLSSVLYFLGIPKSEWVQRDDIL